MKCFFPGAMEREEFYALQKLLRATVCTELFMDLCEDGTISGTELDILKKLCKEWKIKL